MAKRILTRQEVGELIGLLRGLFAHHLRLREEHSLAELIQFPRIPSILSESIVFQLLRSGELFGQPLDVRASKSGGDLELRTSEGSYHRVEVKATGESAFQQLGKKDLEAELFLWLHFGSCFRSPIENELWIIPVNRLGTHIQAPRKITLKQFIAIVGNKGVPIDLKTFDNSPEA